MTLYDYNRDYLQCNAADSIDASAAIAVIDGIAAIDAQSCLFQLVLEFGSLVDHDSWVVAMEVDV